MKELKCSIASTPEEINDIFDLRFEVFVKEQGVPSDLELDELDKTAIQVSARLDGLMIGCGRICLTEDHAHIGRVAVKKEFRAQGIGKKLMEKLIAICQEKGFYHVILHSQIQAIPFYQSLGFVSQGDIFLDAGIEHREMELASSKTKDRED